MSASNTEPRGGAHPIRRRAFLAGMLRASGAVLAAGTVAGCQAAAHREDRIGHGTSDRIVHRPGNRIGHRPNDGSGVWADFSNTGYLHDPGYTGTGGDCTHGYAGLTDYVPGMAANTDMFVDKSAGHVFNQVHFRGQTFLGREVGDDWVFNGCVFDQGGRGTGESNFVVRLFLNTTCTWNYCTFKPVDYATPPGNDGTVTSAHTPPGTPWLSSYQSFGWGWVNGTQRCTGRIKMHHCDIWGNAAMQLMSNGTADNRVILDWCYIHDQADTNWTTGIAAGVPLADRYHHDGIGPADAVSWAEITNCTIASLGNTNAIAFQSGYCHDLVLTGNYISGFGMPVNVAGGVASETATNITFTDNVYSAELPFVWRINYYNFAWDAARRGMLWRRNRLQFFRDDPTMTFAYGDLVPESNGWDPSWHGKYWWSSDNDPHHADYTG